MVHVKQFFKGELKVYANGRSRFHRQIFEEDHEYWFSPWEVESFGMTPGLYHKFLINRREIEDGKA